PPSPTLSKRCGFPSGSPPTVAIWRMGSRNWPTLSSTPRSASEPWSDPGERSQTVDKLTALTRDAVGRDVGVYLCVIEQDGGTLYCLPLTYAQARAAQKGYARGPADRR